LKSQPYRTPAGAAERPLNITDGVLPVNRCELAKTLQAHLLRDGDPSDPVFSSLNFADATLQLIFGLISKKLAAGEEVSIAGYGRWKISESPGGMRRNPRTGRQAAIATVLGSQTGLLYWSGATALGSRLWSRHLKSLMT